MNEESFDLTRARKTFSRIGLALCAILVIATALQVLWFLDRDSWMVTTSWGMWLGTFLPMYLVAIPVSLWIMHKLPAHKPQDHKLGAKKFFVAFAISVCVMYAGNLVGTVLSMVLSGGNAQNAVMEYAMDNNPLKVLFMVILAPLLEEYVCRKQIIDRTRRYGEKTAVFLSALVFGLLHQNLFQFFYAFGLGLIFAYIYTRTGRLRYPILLHMIINFMGGVIAPWLLTLVDMEAMASIDPMASTAELMALYADILPGLAVYMLYFLFLLGMSTTGLVLLIIQCTKLVWFKGEEQLPAGTAIKTVYFNLGMVLYVLLCCVMIVLALL